MQDDAHRLRNHFDQLFDTPTAIPQLLSAAVHHLLNESSREGAKGKAMTPRFFASPRLRVTTELLSQCDALEAKLTQAESSSTQLVSAAVHHLLNGAATNV